MSLNGDIMAERDYQRLRDLLIDKATHHTLLLNAGVSSLKEPCEYLLRSVLDREGFSNRASAVRGILEYLRSERPQAVSLKDTLKGLKDWTILIERLVTAEELDR
jgi:hypothetical protein